MKKNYNIDPTFFLKKALKNSIDTKPKSDWYDRAKIILAAFATTAATMVGWYFTWAHNEHERLTKELEIIKSIADFPDLGLQKADLAMTYLESITDDDIFKRIASGLPKDKKIQILSDYLYRAISIKDYRTIKRIMGVIEPIQILPNNDNQMPIEASIVKNDIKLMETLYETGIRPINESYGSTVDGVKALARASNYGFNKIIDFLLSKGVDPNKTDNLGRNSIFYAVEGYKTDSIKKLHQAGGDVNIHDNNGISPLIMTLDISNYFVFDKEIVNRMTSLLLEYGADPNDFKPFEPNSKSGFRALTLAVNNDLEGAFLSLVDKKADLIIKTYPIEEGTHIAFDIVHLNRVNMLKQLLKRGMEPNIKSKYGYNLLFDIGGNPELVEVLLESGVDPNSPDNYGDVPIVSWIDYPSLMGHTPEEINQYAIEKETNIIISITLAVSHGADVNLQGEYKNTALCRAAKHYGPKLLITLLDLKANVEKECSDNETALEKAIDECKAANVALLLATKPNLAYISNSKESLIEAVKMRAEFYNRNPNLKYLNPQCEDTLGLLTGKINASDVSANIRARSNNRFY